MDYSRIALLNAMRAQDNPSRFDIYFSREQIRHVCSQRAPEELRHLVAITGKDLFEFYISPGAGIPNKLTREGYQYTSTLQQAQDFIREDLRVWQTNIGHFTRDQDDKPFNLDIEAKIFASVLQGFSKGAPIHIQGLEQGIAYLHLQNKMPSQETDTTHHVIL